MMNEVTVERTTFRGKLKILLVSKKEIIEVWPFYWIFCLTHTIAGRVMGLFKDD